MSPLTHQPCPERGGLGQSGAYLCQDLEPGVNPSTVLRPSQESRRNPGRQRAPGILPQTAGKLSFSLRGLTLTHLLPLACTLGAQGPGGPGGSPEPLWVNVGALGSVSPSLYYSSSGLYIWGQSQVKGPLEQCPFQIPCHFLETKSMFSGPQRHCFWSAEGREARKKERQREGSGKGVLTTHPASSITYGINFKSFYGVQSSCQVGCPTAQSNLCLLPWT